MDFGKYEKYMNDRKAVTVENNRRIEKKFAECEKWVADNLINCGCVFTNHSELLQKQSFMIWIDNGISISHKIYKLSECGITPSCTAALSCQNIKITPKASSSQGGILFTAYSVILYFLQVLPLPGLSAVCFQCRL